MENSPPGIQTIPSGAGLGGATVFEIVVANAGDSAEATFSCAKRSRSKAHTERDGDDNEDEAIRVHRR